MKLDVEAIKQFLELRQKLLKGGVININLRLGDVLVDLGTLMDAPNIKIQKRDSELYPYEIRSKFDEVEVYAIAKEDELKKFLERRGQGETI